ncbi:MAG TPA: hypothetical protein VMT11_03005 [Myxococcaceae bacterium]|nr:hypothetical protein [Myxococcaceae bacterium]
MGWADGLGQVLQGVLGGNASEADIHSAFDKVAGAVPHGALAEGISHVFNSDQTPPFEQMLSGLFGQSSPDQKAALVNQVLSGLGPAAGNVLGGVGGLGGLAGVLQGGGTVSAAQAQQIPPQAVEALARKARELNPGIVDAVSGFYAKNPQLVKAIGAGALALLMSRLSKGNR